jgi:DNA (cytosine-5)-methyltransferase 1
LPLPTHGKNGNGDLPSWISLSDWLVLLNYKPLDAISKESAIDRDDALHQVPYYSDDRYLMVADIPKNSGKSAYQNSVCHRCGKKDVLEGKIYCTNCRAPLITRPYVKTGRKYRLIKGFASSYRRMYPDRPSATITTASSHIGSDYKIHPWENRVLSMRECADIQTVPRKYDFSLAFEIDRKYLIRQIIGESLPPWFTYQHGILVSGWLAQKPSRK